MRAERPCSRWFFRYLSGRSFIGSVSYWFQRGTAADGNGESAVKIRHCPAAVKRLLSADVSQNARQRDHTDEDRL